MHRQTVTLLLLLILSAPSLRLTSAQDKPTLKKFGDSIKKLKWDPAKQTGVQADDYTRRPDDEDMVRIQTELVACDVMVLDKQGRIVTGLSANDFRATEDNLPQQVSHFSLGNDKAIERSIVLIIDYSGSMLPYIDRTIDAAKVLVEQLGPKDRLAIVTDDVQLLTDFTNDKKHLLKTLETLRSQARSQPGRSEQFTALLATLRELFDEEDIRPIIIFQTDGDEVISLQPPDPVEAMAYKGRRPPVKQFSLADVYTAAEQSRATLYSVIPGIRLIGLPESDQMERAKIGARKEWDAINTLTPETKRNVSFNEKTIRNWLRGRLDGQVAAAGVAKLTGGWSTFLEDPRQARSIYAEILADINNRYVVGYYPSNKVHDGKRRQVAVEVVNHPEYTVWGRQSYLAPPPDR